MQAMSQLLVRAPGLAAPGKAEVSDVGGEEHPPGPFDMDAQFAAEGRHLSKGAGATEQPRGERTGGAGARGGAELRSPPEAAPRGRQTAQSAARPCCRAD